MSVWSYRVCYGDVFVVPDTVGRRTRIDQGPMVSAIDTNLPLTLEAEKYSLGYLFRCGRLSNTDTVCMAAALLSKDHWSDLADSIAATLSSLSII